ncbi:MAG: AAA family ATPase [Candidatus Methanomethylicaceae archaeon]
MSIITREFTLFQDGRIFKVIGKSMGGSSWLGNCPFSTCGLTLTINETNLKFECPVCGSEGIVLAEDIIDSMELVNDGIPRVQWLVDGLIPEGSLVMITAPPGYFKTWIALKLARCVADGEEFIGRKTERKLSFYIDRENPAQVLSERIKIITSSSNLFFWPLWREPPLIEDVLIYEKAIPSGAFVVFDSLIRFHDAEENDAGEMKRVMFGFRRLASQGRTILLIHHQGKEWREGYRGSSEILGAVDICFAVERGQKENVLRLKNVKNRFGTEGDISLKLEIDETKMQLTDVTGREDEEECLKLRDLIRDFVAQTGRLPKQGNIVAEALKMGFTRDRIFELLNNGEGIYWNVQGLKPKFYVAI